MQHQYYLFYTAQLYTNSTVITCSPSHIIDFNKFHDKKQHLICSYIVISEGIITVEMATHLTFHGGLCCATIFSVHLLFAFICFDLALSGG